MFGTSEAYWYSWNSFKLFMSSQGSSGHKHQNNRPFSIYLGMMPADFASVPPSQVPALPQSITFWTDKYVGGQAALLLMFHLSASVAVVAMAQQEPLQITRAVLLVTALRLVQGSISLLLFYRCLHFLPRGKACLQTGCRQRPPQVPPLAGLCQIQARPNQPWARCSSFVQILLLTQPG